MYCEILLLQEGANNYSCLCSQCFLLRVIIFEVLFEANTIPSNPWAITAACSQSVEMAQQKFSPSLAAFRWVSDEGTYRIIPKIRPEAYIFQRPFLRGLFLEGLTFGGAYLRREICVSKFVGLALQLEGNLLFLLCFNFYLRAISKYKPPVGLYLEGRFNGEYSCILCYDFGGLFLEGLIHGGAYFWNFMVTHGFSLHMQIHFIL